MSAQTTKYQAPDDDVAWLGNDPIPAAPYYQPEYFELERKAVFARTWLQVGHISEMPRPGSFIRRELEFAKASLLIVHGKDGKLRAFHNVCTHRGTQLVEEESGEASSFTCPYHSWTYGYDGELRFAPDFERFHLRKSDCGLPKVAVEVCGGLIFINLDPSPAQSLREFLGSIAVALETLPVARATTFSEYVYEIDANWKMTYDNFQETYHLRALHARTGAATFNEENPFGYPARYAFHGPHRSKTIWRNPTPAIKPVQGFAFAKASQFVQADGLSGPNDQEYFMIFPNCFILGSPSQHFSHVVYPISATKSRGVIRIYWVGEDDCASRRFAREYMMVTVRDIHSEDVGVIAAGQRGLNSGALRHIHFQAQEGLCRHLFYVVNNMVKTYTADCIASGAVA